MLIDSKEDKRVSLDELCRQLSISVATGKNWVKLGKILPETEEGNSILFSQSYVDTLLKEILNNNNKRLKSRRNKKYLNGHNLYLSYISTQSKNIESVKYLLECIEKFEIKIGDTILTTILVDCAKKIFKSAKFKGDFQYLIDDMTSNFGLDETLYVKYPEIFSIDFIYERNEDLLGLIYLSLRNMKDRKLSGAYYTPTEIVRKLCSALFDNDNKLSTKSIIDPCCGSGNFILNLPEQFLYKNVYASDIDLMSVLLTRINFALKFNVSDKVILYSHVTQADYLNDTQGRSYDFVIGNPPWGYNFTDAQKNNLKKKYYSAQGNNVESFDVVTEKAILDLNSDGIVSFVLPESFLNVKAHSNIRRFLMDKCSIIYVEYLGDVFDGVQCPSVILQIKYNNKSMTTKGMLVKCKDNIFKISAERELDVDCLNFLINDEQYDVMQKILKYPNTILLKGNAKFALGIVTGDNKTCIVNRNEVGYEPIIKGSDVFKYNYATPNNFIKFEPSKFQQVAPVEMYRAKEKLFYRFVSNKLVFAYDNKQILSLNSCNILIPELRELSVKYVLAVLNSSVAQFFFTKRFNSFKVLRAHIEQIPIPIVDKSVQMEIENIVDQILSTDKSDKSLLIEMLDKKVAKLYSLDDDDYNKILKNVI